MQNSRPWACARLVVLAIFALHASAAETPAQPAATQAAKPGKYEKEIAAFEAADKVQAPAQGGLLFTGASSIRMWSSLQQDFPGKTILNRGFGGSEIADSTRDFDRFILPCHPKTIYFRAGGNDLAHGKSVEQVFADFKDLAAAVEAKLPGCDLVYVSLSPSPARWSQADKEKALNTLIADFVKGKPHLRSIDTYDMVLGPDGKPRVELFIADQLHFNAAGYKLLAEKVRPDVER